MRSGLVIATFGLGACSASESEVFVPLPPELLSPGTETLIAAAEGPSQPVRAFVFDASDPVAIELEAVDAEAETIITGLAFDEPSSQLGLEPRPVGALEGPAVRLSQMRPSRVMRTSVRGEEVLAWTPAELDGALRDLPVRPADKSACERTTVTVLTVLEPVDLHAMIRLPDGRLIGAGDEAERFGTVGTLTEGPERTMVYEELARPGLDRIFVLDWDGVDTIYGEGFSRMFQMRTDGSGQLSWPTPGGVTRVSGGAGRVIAFPGLFELTRGSTIAVPIPGAPAHLSRAMVLTEERILALTSDGEIYHLDGESWALEYTFEASDDPNHLTPRTLDGSAETPLALSRKGVWRRDASGSWLAMEPPFPFPSNNLVLRALDLGEGRLLVTSDVGQLAIWDGRSWCSLSTGTNRYWGRGRAWLGGEGRTAYVFDGTDDSPARTHSLVAKVTLPATW